MPGTITHPEDNPDRHAAALERLERLLDKAEIFLKAGYEQGCDDTLKAMGGRRIRSRPACTGPRPDLRVVTDESVRLILEASRS